MMSHLRTLVKTSAHSYHDANQPCRHGAHQPCCHGMTYICVQGSIPDRLIREERRGEEERVEEERRERKCEGEMEKEWEGGKETVLLIVVVFFGRYRVYF